MQKITGFGLSNRGTKACEFCGVLSWASRQDETANSACCTACFDAAGYENEHQDGYHADRVEPLCPTCDPARETRRLARAAARVASYEPAAARRAEKAIAREAVKVARAAAIKHCSSTRNIYRAGQVIATEPCDGRASKTSPYCSTCRPYHPHTATRFSAADAAFLATHGRDASQACGLCGLANSDQIHQEVKS
jgi:hypothetical protein